MWRSEEEMLEVVRLRARRLRARQHVLATGVATALLFVCGTAIALSRGSGGGAAGTAVRVAAPAGVGETSTSTPSLALGSPPFPFPTNLPSAPVPTTTPGTAPITVPPTAPPVVATEPPPPGASSAAPAPTPPLEPCSPADVAASVTTDKPSYLPGQPVRITGALRNISGRECGSNAWGHVTDVTDASGKQVWGLTLQAHGDCFDSPCRGTTLMTQAAEVCWDQLLEETREPVPLGTYKVKIEWRGSVNPAVSATTTVQIVPDPAAPTTTVPPRCY